MEELFMLEFAENMSYLVRKERCITRNITLAKMRGDGEDLVFYEDQLASLRNVGRSGFATLSLRAVTGQSAVLQAELLELERE